MAKYVLAGLVIGLATGALLAGFHWVIIPAALAGAVVGVALGIIHNKMIPTPDPIYWGSDQPKEFSAYIPKAATIKKIEWHEGSYPQHMLKQNAFQSDLINPRDAHILFALQDGDKSYHLQAKTVRDGNGYIIPESGSVVGNLEDFEKSLISMAGGKVQKDPDGNLIREKGCIKMEGGDQEFLILLRESCSQTLRNGIENTIRAQLQDVLPAFLDESMVGLYTIIPKASKINIHKKSQTHFTVEISSEVQARALGRDDVIKSVGSLPITYSITFEKGAAGWAITEVLTEIGEKLQPM